MPSPPYRRALLTASSDDQIWVAAGVYYPDEGTGQTGDVVTSTFVLTNGVALYGGFTGTETVLGDRDWAANVTVLSGDIDQDDGTDPHGVVTDTANIADSNASHVVSSLRMTNTAVLDGFTITAGTATGGQPHHQGGGMYNNASSPTLANVAFTGNRADRGGGMFNDTIGVGVYAEGSSPTLSNVTFSGNTAVIRGGGMYNDGSSSPTLSNVTLSGNTAGDFGGGIYDAGGNPMLSNVTFSGNTAGYFGGGMTISGSSPTLSNVTLSGNTAGDFGGGMYNEGNRFSIASSPTLTNVTFTGNRADRGGGMFNDTFSDGEYVSSPTLTNVTFTGNTAVVHGGGMYNNSGSSSSSNSPILTNVTLSGNTAGDFGGEIYNAGSSPTLTNTILWGNTASSGSQIANDGTSTTMIGYSDIEGAYSGGGWDASLGIDGGGNLDADPLFVRNPDPGPDSNWDGVDDDYGDLHLQGASPAVNTGTNTGCPAFDLDGMLRPIGPTCDMGVHEANAWPVAVDDGGAGFTTDEDAAFTTANVLTNDSDSDGHPLTVVSFDASGISGLITSNGDGTFAHDPNGQFEDLAAGESATDVFQYTVSDGLDGMATATFTITVTAVDDGFYIYLPTVLR